MKLADTCLQLDVGNSSAKWRLLRAGEVLARGRYQSGEDSSRSALLDCTTDLQQVWVSSVASRERNAQLTCLLQERWGIEPWFARTAGQTGTLLNSYLEPERMGVDRWLVMLGASRHLDGRFAVVDAGSALTIDIVAASGQHEGGYIIPGPVLMERALLLDTDRVRFAEDAGYDLAPGRSTAEAVRHGIAAAQAGAVSLLLARAGLDSGQVLFCGGGADALMQLVSIGGSLVPDLVFEGLEVMATSLEII
jgi:type III pantothenate kinase